MMRVALSLCVLLACTAATPPLSEEKPPLPADPANLQIPSPPSEAVCRDTIVQARAERGLPELQRETADPGKPYFIAAVDKRIDGCSVMVMRNDTSEIRPLPKPENRTTLRPAQ